VETPVISAKTVQNAIKPTKIVKAKKSPIFASWMRKNGSEIQAIYGK